MTIRLLASLLCGTLTLDCLATDRDPVPVLFGAGIISGPQHDSAPAFSRDGRAVWFSRSDNGTAVCRGVAKRDSETRMRALTIALFAAAFALSACHPGGPPAPEGTVNSTAAAVSAGSAPATDGTTLAQDRSASESAAATDAQTASAAIAAQSASRSSASTH